MRQSTRSESGFTLVDVMIAMTLTVVALMAVVSATTTTSMVRRQAIQEDQVFSALHAQMEWVRGELYADTTFHNKMIAAVNLEGEYLAGFMVDQDGDGVQDLSASPGDKETPVVTVRVSPALPWNNASQAVQVDITGTWYGIGKQRTLSLSGLVSNRTGYKGA